jgi:hypothetical protein
MDAARVRDTPQVTDDRVAEALARVTALEGHDEGLASEVERVSSLLRRAAEIRGGAARVRERLDAIPGELAASERSEADARGREAEARAEHAGAERRADELARARRPGSEARAQAERDVVRTLDGVHDAVGRVARVIVRRAEVADEQRGLRLEADELVRAARSVAADIGTLPRVSASGRDEPGGGLPELEEWGARAHAALFIARSTLEAERERVVDEARATGAALLGEPLAGTSVKLVRRRLQQSASL